MDWEVRMIVESQKAIEKEEITSTEFPGGGNTINAKRTPWHPNVCLSVICLLSDSCLQTLYNLKKTKKT